MGLLFSCQPSDQAGVAAPAAQQQPKAKKAGGRADGKKPQVSVIRLRPLTMGTLDSETAPTVDAIRAGLPDDYQVAAAEGEDAHGAVEVRLENELVVTLYPDEEGVRILRAVATSPKVVAPQGVRLGKRLGDHHNWDKMTCMPGEADLAAHVVCHAVSGARIAFAAAVPAGGEGRGEAESSVEKEAAAELLISHIIWNPKDPEEEAVTVGGEAPNDKGSSEEEPSDDAEDQE